MRIAQVITRSDAVGGAHIHLMALCGELKQAGHDVCVFTGGTGPFIDELKRHQIEFQSLRFMKREISPFFDLLVLFELIAALRRFAPEIVCAHSSKAGWLTRLAAFLLRKPSVFTVHGWAFTEGVARLNRALYILIERVMVPFTHKIITVSRYDQNLAFKYLRRLSPERIDVIHNGVQDLGLQQAKPDSPRPRIVMVARFDVPKDHRLLLLALSDLPHRDWVLDLVGEGPTKAACEALTKELGIEKNVRFLGFRHDVHDVLIAAQIFVLVSNYEAFPLSILEAMRAGLPSVVSNVGGVGESVEHGVTGFLVKVGDRAELSGAIGKLLGDVSLRGKFGVAAHQKFIKEFTLQRSVGSTVGLYKALVDQHA